MFLNLSAVLICHKWPGSLLNCCGCQNAYLFLKGSKSELNTPFLIALYSSLSGMEVLELAARLNIPTWWTFIYACKLIILHDIYMYVGFNYCFFNKCIWEIKPSGAKQHLPHFCAVVGDQQLAVKIVNKHVAEQKGSTSLSVCLPALQAQSFSVLFYCQVRNELLLSMKQMLNLCLCIKPLNWSYSYEKHLWKPAASSKTVSAPAPLSWDLSPLFR